MFEENFNSNHSWYAMLVRMGKEKTIKQHILKSDVEIDDIIIPEPPQKATEDEEFNLRYMILLGYIFVKTKLNVDSYQQLLKIESVYRFLGSIRFISDIPSVVSMTSTIYFPCRIMEYQIVNLKKYLNGEYKEEIDEKSMFNLGDDVEIISGDLSSVHGKISNLVGNYAYITPQKFFTQTIKVPIKKIAHYMSE